MVGEYIENQLNMRQSGLVEWFQEVELPRIARFFLPLLNNWSMEYAGRFAQTTLCFWQNIFVPLDNPVASQLLYFPMLVNFKSIFLFDSPIIPHFRI